MTTRKLLITGLGARATEESIRSWLGRFGPVVQIQFIRDGDADHPVAIVEMEIGLGAAVYLVLRVSGYEHDGDRVTARLLEH